MAKGQPFGGKQAPPFQRGSAPKAPAMGMSSTMKCQDCGAAGNSSQQMHGSHGKMIKPVK